MSNRNSILRWALPPGVSLAIHATLIALLVIVGSRAASIATQIPKTTHIPLAELEFTPPPSPSNTQDQSTPRDDQPAAQRPPSTLDQNAQALTTPTPVTSQAMSVATLEQLTKQSTALSTEPNAAPTPISFAGVQTGAARSIVYVIDTSGATLTSLTYIRERLLQSIDRLSPTQRFQVIAFRQLQDSKYTIPDLQTKRNKLPRATRQNKQLVADWLATMPAQGRSNPVAGLEAALKLNPDMILLISRGIQRTEAPWAGGLKHVRQTLDQLNPINTKAGRRPVVIKTIQLLDEDPTGIMRTIGVFHGDGHNDHQVITYNQLISPDPEPQTPPPSNTDARLTAAEDQLASLKATGAYYRATTSIPTNADTETITTALIRINAMLAKSSKDDPRAALLFAEAHLLSPSAAVDLASLIEALDDTVFVSPDLDARRRIALSQLTNDPADLLTLLEEQPQLNYAQITAAHAILILASHNQTDSQTTNQPPFTSDPAWALILAQTQTLSNLTNNTQSPLTPLLTLRNNLPPLEPQIDASIVRLVNTTNTNPATLANLPRFIIAKANISTGDQDNRLAAINTLLTLAETNDPSDNQDLAQESLWLACLGARALNTHDANQSLILAAAKLAHLFPDHPGAPDALAGAIDAATQTNSPNLRPLLQQAIAQYPSRIEIDLWRLQLINLTTGSEQTTLIKSLTPATRESDLGAEIYHNNALAVTPSDQLTHAIATANTLDQLRSPLSNHWHRAAAELEVDTDPISATIRLSRLMQKNINPQNPELELLYARALLGADQPDQALPRLTTLAAAFNTNPNKHFWHAWTLILETIINQGTAPDKQNARAHLTRLKLIDPDLGPEPYRSRLIKAQNTLHSQP